MAHREPPYPTLTQSRLRPFLYLTGTSFTGSTLLALLLNAHPEMTTIGEVSGLIPSTDPETYPCSCGRLLRDCSFWKKVSEAMTRRGFEFDLRRWDLGFDLAHSRLMQVLLGRSLGSNTVETARDHLVRVLPIWGPRIRQRIERNAAFADSVLEVSAASVFVDASKDPSRIPFLRRLPRFELRVVHLVRDPRGFASSYMRHADAPISEALRFWLSRARRGHRLLRMLPEGRSICVRYEDLCRDPVSEIAQIFQLADLEPLEGPIRFREVPHHVIGNAMRVGDSNEIVLDERWRSHLSSREASWILDRTRRERSWFGYPDEPD